MEKPPRGPNTKVVKPTIAVPKVGEEEFDDVISDNAQYGRIQFWDLKYATEHEPFEWYYGYDSFRETIRDNVPLDAKVMVAGCGSSNLLGDMADDGYQKLVAADLSRVVITQLKYRYQDYPQISYFQGTLTDTDLPEGSLDAVIDKGLFDALLCTQTGALTVGQYIYEVDLSLLLSFLTCVTLSRYNNALQVERILSDTGVFIIISYGNPEQRLPFLEQHDIDVPRYTPWTIEVQALCKCCFIAFAEPTVLWISVCTAKLTTVSWITMPACVLSLTCMLFFYTVKPKEYPEEELDSADPDSYYFVYIISKRLEMVLKKNVKLGRLNQKQMKALLPARKRAPNLKPT
jgi:hypothetical protein